HIHLTPLSSPCYPDYHLPFFFTDTATTEIYTLSLHDALPILTAMDQKDCVFSPRVVVVAAGGRIDFLNSDRLLHNLHSTPSANPDRKSTRLNSSHLVISYAVFCLKKKKK